MLWNLLVVLRIIWIEVLVDALALPHIHWNSSNPMFKESKNELKIKVNMNDEIDFICPFVTDKKSYHLFEYYIIYEVGEDEYKNCYLNPDRKYDMIVNCNDPGKQKIFTIIFQQFSPNPGANDYKHGQAYYYISTSTGTKDGLHNLQKGACTNKNLRLVFEVCCDSTVDTTKTGITQPSINKNKATHAPITPNDIDNKHSKTEKTHETNTVKNDAFREKNVNINNQAWVLKCSFKTKFLTVIVIFLSIFCVMKNC